jgi:hypothetical protein
MTALAGAAGGEENPRSEAEAADWSAAPTVRWFKGTVELPDPGDACCFAYSPEDPPISRSNFKGT